MEAAAYGITPNNPARRAGSGVPPNISDTFFYPIQFPPYIHN